MATKTQINVTIKLAGGVPVNYVSRSALHRKSKPKPGRVTLGVTELHASYAPPTLYFDEVSDPIGGTVEYTIKQIDLVVSFAISTDLDNAIPKSTPCHAHVSAHEKRHVKIFQTGCKASAAKIEKAVRKAIKPLVAKPVLVKENQAKAFRQLAFDKVDAVVSGVVQKVHDDLVDESEKKVHTKSEAKKTQTICAAYI